MKTMLAEAGSMLGKTLLVTLTIPLAYMLGGFLGLPDWMQILAFLPAAWLFCKLSEQTIPPVSVWLPFVAGLMLLSFLLDTFFPQMPTAYRVLFFVALLQLLPGLLKRAEKPPAAH